MSGIAPPLLEARRVSVSFPGVRALDAVDFEIRTGEVHALVGENGAGKSTLIRVLSGEIGEYDGALLLNGVDRRFGSPREAICRSRMAGSTAVSARNTTSSMGRA